MTCQPSDSARAGVPAPPAGSGQAHVLYNYSLPRNSFRNPTKTGLGNAGIP